MLTIYFVFHSRGQELQTRSCRAFGLREPRWRGRGYIRERSHVVSIRWVRMQLDLMMLTFFRNIFI